MVLEWTYGADSIGVMLLDISSDCRVHSTPPALDGAVDIMGSGVTGLLPQVIKLERDLVFGVQDPTISKVTMLCDYDLGRKKLTKTIINKYRVT